MSNLAKSKRGKFGITRDADGSLSSLWEWPWYWRYSAGLMIFVLAGYLSLQNKNELTQLVLVGGGALFALSLMYELGCLVICALLAWGAWAALSLVIPNSVDIPLPVKLAAMGAAIAYAWFLAKTALDLAERNKKALDAAANRDARIEDKLDFNIGELYHRIAMLEERVSNLDGRRR